MTKIKLNSDRLFRADVAVVLPTEEKGKDQTIVLDTLFRFPQQGELWLAANIVKDIVNLDDVVEAEDELSREQVVQTLCSDPCFAPAFLKVFEDSTTGKNTRSAS